MQILLLVAAIASLIIQQWGTVLLQVVLTLFNALLALCQDGNAKESVVALQKMMIVNSRVRREGQVIELPVEQIVPGAIEHILVKLETRQFMINLGGAIGIGVTACRRRESNGASSSFPIALALMFVACLEVATFFLHDHDEIQAIIALGLTAFIGLRLFFR